MRLGDVGQRVFTALGSVIFVITLAFFMLNILPGNAVRNTLLAAGASEALIAERERQLGLDRPLLEHYADYFSGVLRGDLGVSFVDRIPVVEKITLRLGSTIELATSAIVIGVVTSQGFTWGCFLAPVSIRWLFRRLVDLLQSLPLFLTAPLASYIIAAQLHLLPATGQGTLRHLILPATMLGIHMGALIAREQISMMTAQLEQPYVTSAYARGLNDRLIFFRHIWRVTLPQTLIFIGLQFGFLLSGVAITEVIFARSGLGQLMISSIISQDYPVVLGIIIWSVVIYTLIEMILNGVVVYLDPRLRYV